MDTQEIGRVYDGQANKAIYTGSVWDPAIPKNNLFKRMDKSAVVTQIPVLSLQAKLTDLISGSALGSGLELMVSDKLKKILAAENSGLIQFFPMQIIFKKKLMPGYWIVHPSAIDMEAVDFSNSVVKISNIDGTEKRSVTIEDVAAFDKRRAAMSISEWIWIDELVIKASFRKSFFHINFVKGGVGYFVSSEIKNEIEESNCTGIVFTKSNEIYP